MPRSNDSPICLRPPRGVKPSVSLNAFFCAVQNPSVIESYEAPPKVEGGVSTTLPSWHEWVEDECQLLCAY